MLSVAGRMALFATVFLTGAAVMVIELLGTRLIAPFYGASLYVWSSLISVTMMALALGYFVGGYWADRARRTGLALVISLAAVLTVLIPWVTRPVLLATDPLGLRAGAFVSALVLFFPALTMLGMVGPFAIKLSTERLDGVGSGAGTIYAVSTLGSVVGTLLLGFFLFPLVGSRSILLGLGAGLLALGLAVAYFEQRGLHRQRALVSSAVLAVLGALLLPQAVRAGAPGQLGGGKFTLVSERETLYGWVRVIDEPKRDLRLLTSDASTIGAASISDRASRLFYQDIVQLIPALRPGIRRALLIGQGAGHMAMVLRSRYGVSTDTIEIDPAVADAAARHFGFVPSGRTIVGDARYEVRRLQDRYDLIILDCFTGGTEPSHLLTVEFLQQLRGLLTDHGLVSLNLVAFADGGRNPALAAVYRTIAEVFPDQSVFMSEPGENFNDFIFLASRTPIDRRSGTLRADEAAWLDERALAIDSRDGVLLTDDLNALEKLQARKSEYYRNMIVEWLGTDTLVR